MLAKKFTEYVMRGRFEAAWVALILTIIPFVGWLGTAVMGLVTLRKGPYEGFMILMWTALPSLLLFALGHHLQFYVQVFALSLIVWLLAIVLRMMASWSQVLLASAGLAIIVVLFAHAVVNDLPAFWYNFIQSHFAELKNIRSLPSDQAELTGSLHAFAKMATGQVALIFLLLNLGTLAVARWLQAQVFNPGGFAKELCNIRLPKSSNVILLLIIAAILLDITAAWDLLPITLGMFFLAGLSLFHALIKRTRYELAGVVGFYALLLLAIIFQYAAIADMIVIIVIMGAIIDSWWDIRAKSWLTPLK